MVCNVPPSVTRMAKRASVFRVAGLLTRGIEVRGSPCDVETDRLLRFKSVVDWWNVFCRDFLFFFGRRVVFSPMVSLLKKSVTRTPTCILFISL